MEKERELKDLMVPFICSRVPREYFYLNEVQEIFYKNGSEKKDKKLDL